MRQGYEIKRIKEICKKGSSNVAQKDLKDCDGEYPIYGASGFIKKVNFFHQEEECIGLVKDGAGVGRVLFLPPQSSVIGTLQYIKPNEGYDIRYIGYCLQSINLSKYSQGATIPHIYFKDYGEEQVVVATDTLEQQRIVDILDAEFAKIDALQDNAEKNLQNAKDLFQAVLRKKLEPKEGWNTASLSELYDVRDGTHDSPKYVSTGYPFVTSKNLKNGEIDMSDVKYISKADFDKINERSKVDKGDVLFAMIGSNLGHPALVVDEPQYAIKNVALFKVPTNMSGLLLTYLLSSDIVMNKVNKEKNGSSQPFVSLKYLRNFIVSVPKTLKEQEELASAIKQQDIRCQTIIGHYYKTCLLCNDLKQALLRKAFNGEL